MDPKALRGLHLDVRLQRRHGWIDRSELAGALAELPDVSDKVEEKASPETEKQRPGAPDSES
jgi:hypothetical protein